MQNFNEFQKPNVQKPDAPADSVGKPFQRYIGRDEVNKRALGGLRSFDRPPVVAPPPNLGGNRLPTAPAPVPAPVPIAPVVNSAPVTPGNNGGFVGTSAPTAIPQRPIPIPAPMNAGYRAPVQPMPTVPQRPIQYSLANRGWGG
jgi:hypothetical protein